MENNIGKAKAYCTCRGAANQGYTNLPRSESDGSIPWCHAKCRRPSRAWFDKYVKRCEVCLKAFSSPYETTCKPCFEEEPTHDGPYRGWGWARKQPTY